MTIQTLKPIIEEFGLEWGDDFNESTTLEEIYLDSLDLVELVMLIEDKGEETGEWPSDIPGSEVEKWKTLGDIVKYANTAQS